MTKQTQNKVDEKAKLAAEIETATDAFIAKHQLVVVEEEEGFYITGKLGIGIFYQKKLHKSFKMRLPTMGENLALTSKDHTERLIESFAQVLLSLGELPPEQLTYEQLKQRITGPDIEVLFEAQDVLIKKLEAISGV